MKTERKLYEEMLEIFLNMTDSDEYIDFCERKIDSLNQKKDKAIERRMQTGALSDEITEAIFNCLNDETFLGAEDIWNLSELDCSLDQIKYRLGRLEKLNLPVESIIFKSTDADGKLHRIKKYKLINEG